MCIPIERLLLGLGRVRRLRRRLLQLLRLRRLLPRRPRCEAGISRESAIHAGGHEGSVKRHTAPHTNGFTTRPQARQIAQEKGARMAGFAQEFEFPC